MTRKRFNRVGGYVYDGDKCISHFEDVSHRDDIVKLLNELHDEKQSVIDWIDRKIEEIKPYNSELCRATLLELKELLE